jgi:hypothetical protein
MLPITGGLIMGYYVEWMLKTNDRNVIIERGLTAEAVATLFGSKDCVVLTARILFE